MLVPAPGSVETLCCGACSRGRRCAPHAWVDVTAARAAAFLHSGQDGRQLRLRSAVRTLLCVAPQTPACTLPRRR